MSGQKRFKEWTFCMVHERACVAYCSECNGDRYLVQVTPTEAVSQADSAGYRRGLQDAVAALKRRCAGDVTVLVEMILALAAKEAER